MPPAFKILFFVDRFNQLKVTEQEHLNTITFVNNCIFSNRNIRFLRALF